MVPYNTVIAGASTNVVTPSTGELNQGNDQLTVYNSAKNNGYYRQMSQQIFNLSAELINVIEAAGLTPGASNAQTLLALTSFFAPPIGSIVAKASVNVPAGYLECDGSAVSRTTYANLFTEIGVVWGAGNGTTTFNLPDMRGYFPRGWAHGGSVDSGRAFGSSQTDAFQGHYHSVGGSTAGLKDSATNGPDNVVAANAVGEGTLTTAYVTDGTNGTPRTATETRPINKTFMYCIKY